MSTRSAGYRDAVEHLPEGAILVLQDVSWEDYEQLVDDLAEDRPAVRVSYDAGRLEIMSPHSGHEEYIRFIERIIHALGDALDLNVEPRGATTWKKRRDRKGAEGDSCYYVANSTRIIGNHNLDVNVDPPPDLVVEIDATNESLTKFPIYAAFGVPEIWRYDAKHSRILMYELRDRSYVEIASSRSFPILTPKALADFIDQSKLHGQKVALAAFRSWIEKR